MASSTYPFFSVSCSSCATSRKSSMNSIPSSSLSCLKVKTLTFSLSSRFSQIGACHLTPWNGLRHFGISISAKPQKLGIREKCKGKVVYASLFGVGAPEFLVIGAVALMVFGPKGLAEVARNLGKTLREFQPAIKELQEVSREFKSTLEREISLDDDPSAMRNKNGSISSNLEPTQSDSSLDGSQTEAVIDTNGAPPNTTYSSELNSDSNVIEEQLNMATQQDVTSVPLDNPVDIESRTQDGSIPNNANSTEDNLKIIEEEPEAAVAVQKHVTFASQESHIEIESEPPGAIQETSVAAPAVQESGSET